MRHTSEKDEASLASYTQFYATYVRYVRKKEMEALSLVA